MCPSGSGTGTPITAPAIIQGAPGFYKKDYREAVAKVFGLHVGKAWTNDAGVAAPEAQLPNSFTHLCDASLTRFADDYFNGMQIEYKGALAWVTDFESNHEGMSFDGPSVYGVLTVSPPISWDVFKTNDADVDEYRIYQRVSKEDIDDAIDMACAGYEVATSLVPKTDSLDYYVTGVRLLQRRQQIIGVWVRPHNDVRYPPMAVQGWQLEEAEGLLTFRMPYLLNPDDSVWLTYYAAEHEVSEEEWLPLPLQLVRARAVVYLLENKLNITSERDWYGTQLRYWSEKARIEEQKFERAAKKVKVLPWQLSEATGGDTWDSAMNKFRTY